MFFFVQWSLIIWMEVDTIDFIALRTIQGQWTITFEGTGTLSTFSFYITSYFRRRTNLITATPSQRALTVNCILQDRKCGYAVDVSLSIICAVRSSSRRRTGDSLIEVICSIEGSEIGSKSYSKLAKREGNNTSSKSSLFSIDLHPTTALSVI